jgi:cytochrome c biogenesis protein CcmG, thiol:disulfide interchange protein DsbE
MDRRRLVGLALVVAGVALVGAQFLRAAGDTAVMARKNACRALTPNPVPNKLSGGAPDFELSDHNGQKVSLKSLRGKPVLLNFWATWCEPCVKEMPSMEELARRLGDRAVVLAVSVDEDWAVVKKFFGDRGWPLSVVLDTSKEVPKKYGTEKYPETFLIDAEGKVREYFISERNWAIPEAAMCIESLL